MKNRKKEVVRLIYSTFADNVPLEIVVKRDYISMSFKNGYVLGYSSKTITVGSQNFFRVGTIKEDKRKFAWSIQHFSLEDCIAVLFFMCRIDTIVNLRKKTEIILTTNWAETLHSVLLILGVWKKHRLFCRLDRNVVKYICQLAIQ